ncbi:MAG: hypothetical protein R3229_00140 [Alphaproteobacteria bacterium]|nr:hypothetical protein [Alphaproteobacteria bacterium]
MKILAPIAMAVLALWLGAGGALAAPGEKQGPGGALDRFLGNQPQFFKLLPFNIPVIRDGRVVNQISFIISIETFGQADKEKVMAARHQLQNVFLRDLYGIVAVRRDDGRSVPIESVKVRLLRLARELVPGDVVKDVLVESAVNIRLN